MSDSIFVHSFESLAALDGPGIRLAVFLAGCPLRCVYCHNPETWLQEKAESYTAETLHKKALRYVPYFADNGGVTLSGGEPLLQAEAILPLVEMLQNSDIRVALDTAGSLYNSSVDALLRKKPMLLLDIKMPDEVRYKKYTGGQLCTTLQVLEKANEYGCEVWLRYVVVPGLNDAAQDVQMVIDTAKRYPCVNNINLLPYHTLGVGKYKALGIPYPLADTLPPSEEKMAYLQGLVDTGFIKNK